MSLSCRKFTPALALVLLGGASAAWGQQNYFVPNVETQAEWDSNWEMVPKEQRDAMASYRANLGARMGRRSQTSSIELRPRISVQEYPDREGVDPVEYFLDLRTTKKTQRSTLLVAGRFSRRDAFNAEYGSATFNELNPELSKVNDSGIIFVGATRTSYELEPRYDFELNERTGLGGRIDAERTRYHPLEVIGRSGFDNLIGQFFFLRKLGQLTELTVGPYVGKFKTPTDSNNTDILGAGVQLHHEWSSISFVEVSLNVEQDETTERDDNGVITVKDDKSTAWGLEVTGYRRNKVGGFRYTVGRTIDPSSFGDRRTTDQVRLQFERPLSPLLSILAAGRFTHEVPVGNADIAKRDRFFGELSLRKQFGPLWYASAGYRYGFQDIETAGNFQNHGVFLIVGFRGRDPERLR